MNVEVEEIRNSTDNEMTHARAMWDERELEPMQCANTSAQRKTVKGR